MIMDVLTQQTTLNVHLPSQPTFANYCVGRNANVLQTLQRYVNEPVNGPLVSDQLTYLWGQSGVGRTHLLQAMCYQADCAYQTAVYLPLKTLPNLTPAALEGLERLTLVCLDDIDTIAGDRQWEAALFHLYNRLSEHQHRLVVTASLSPAEINIVLPDLKSRLISGITFQVYPLSDEDKCQALRQHARLRGMHLPEEVIRFLIRRTSRDMAVLLSHLETLDQASLAAKHTLTLPFVKKVLDLDNSSAACDKVLETP